MAAIRWLFLIILMSVSVFNTSSGQDSLDSVCDIAALFAEYNALDETISVQCLDASGDVRTIMPDAGGGSLSPDGNYIAYYSVSRDETSDFVDEMSLLIYAIDTDESTTVLENYGHIAAIWTLTNELIISTWDDRITVYAVFKPDHRFLYNPQSEQIIELDWPTGNGTRIVGYWPEGNSFLLANYTDGLFQISRDGTSAPISLPVRPYSSHFIMSSDGHFVAYNIQCEDEYTSWTCFAVYELGSNNVETITAFAETYEVSGYFEFSPTGRYIAVLLDRYHVGIYDLEQNEIAFELPEVDANGFVWARDEDLLFIAVADTDNEQDNLSYIYSANPQSGEMELLTPESLRLIGFY